MLTTNSTVTRKADGTTIQRKRIRYVCYNKTRRRQECSGQTGYTMHILDDMITEILHQVFDKMKAVSGEQVVGLTLQQQMNELQADLSKAKSENVKANKEYEALKSELLKTIQGKSELPKDVLSEMLEEARNKVLESSKRVTDLTLQLEQKNGIIADMQAEYDRIASWSEIFDQSDMAVKKMICSYIIERVVVHRGYELEVKFNINVEQFLNGIDSVTEELQIAQ